jgi:putative peptidoglycan lipid II flippase
MLIKVLAPGYYSRQDTKTPVKYGIIAMVTNIVFNAIFAYFYGYVGLAIATALSALVNMVLLYRGLHLAEVYQITKRTVFFIIRLVIAGAAMVAAILWQLEDMSVWLEWSFAYRSGVLGMLIALGAAVYLVVLFLTGVRLKDLKAGTE